MSTFASDDFTGSAVTLETHDANWVNIYGGAGSASLDGGGQAYGGPAFYKYNTTPPAADYTVTNNIYVVGNNGEKMGVVGRATVDGKFYVFYYDQNNGDWELYYYDGASFNAIGTPYSQSLTNTHTYECTLEMSGDTISGKVDGVTRVTGTDANLASAGLSGIYIYATSAAGLLSISWQADGTAAALTQYYLSSDKAVGAWTTEAGGTSALYTHIDETSPDTTDYVKSETDPSSSSYKAAFGTIATPASNTNHTLSYTIKSDNGCDLVVKLYAADNTLIKTSTYTGGTPSDAWTRYDVSLSTGEADSLAGGGYTGSYIEVIAG